jgi:seryl-tRNA synthetase
MWSAEAVVQALESWGELWESAPGLVGLRGEALTVYRRLEDRIASLAAEETGEEWRVPAGLPISALGRADYFASFPQWLTTAAHLRDDEGELERVASSADPEAAIAGAIAPPGTALPPAVCYHAYLALADSVLEETRIVTSQATCWRHEGDRLRPLERGWAFTMREIVCIGTHGEVEAFRRRMIDRVQHLAEELGLEATLVPANDPFFAPTSRGKALLQRIKALKDELLLPAGPVRSIAAASFNHHETFFGEAFGITLPDGSPAASGCVAFGLERWLLAYLVAHGPGSSRDARLALADYPKHFSDAY